MLNKILVPVRGDGMAGTVLAHASILAKRHSAHIVVAHCRPRTEDLMPYGAALPAFARKTIAEQARELADQQEQDVRDQLHDWAQSVDLTEAEDPAHGRASVKFVEEYGRMAEVIKHNGRLADLIVVAKPDRDRNLGANSLKSGLFATGRPVFMCPPHGAAPSDLGAHVTIAWNGSLEASRAVAMTLEVVRAASKVTILSGGKGEAHGATTSELVEYYRLHGVTASVEQFSARNPGAALLEKTVELGANLLIMGAYGHTHERETLFGGNTQAVVDKAEIPVILVH
ncbi:MAG: universal stress protein [Pseudomonadota bacterium]